MSTSDGPTAQTDDDRVDLVDGVDHQVAMVMDLNKCIGCQTCTVVCKPLWAKDDGRDYMYWNNVETKPGKGYLCDWEDSGGGWTDAEHTERSLGDIPDQTNCDGTWSLNHEEVMYNDGDWPLRPDDDPEWGPNQDEDQGADEYSNSYYSYPPHICNHCTHPSCMEACPRKTIYKREEDGTVLIDQEHCHGYHYCAGGCPYRKVYYNATRKTSEKCIFCYPHIESEGLDGETLVPVYTENYPPQLRLVRFLDDEQGPIHKFVEEYEVALPLHPEYQTQPNVYYIPSFAPSQYSEDGKTVGADHTPRNYLEEPFGDRVHDVPDTIEKERDKVDRGGESELPDMLTDINPIRKYRLEVFD